MNPKIGQHTPEGTVYPSETITGKPYARGEIDPPPLVVHQLDDTHFAIGDPFAPVGFDVDAALAALRAELAPAVTPATKRVTSTIVEA